MEFNVVYCISLCSILVAHWVWMRIGMRMLGEIWVMRWIKWWWRIRFGTYFTFSNFFFFFVAPASFEREEWGGRIVGGRGLRGEGSTLMSIRHVQNREPHASQDLFNQITLPPPFSQGVKRKKCIQNDE